MRNTISISNRARFLSIFVLCLSFFATSLVQPRVETSLTTTQTTATTTASREHKHGFVPPKLIERADLYAKLHNVQAPIVTMPAPAASTPNQATSSVASDNPLVLIYDARHAKYIPGYRARFEGTFADPVADNTVNQAFEYHKAMRSFLDDVYDRNSIDNKGADLVGTVHYGWHVSNAYWNGHQMLYGDGDEQFFGSFVVLDVVGHEIFHAVTEKTSGLTYYGQSGALDEHMSDVFGVLLRQWHENLTVDKDNWLVGPGLFTKNVNGRALRDMRYPGTAYNDPFMGKDTQPAHMKDFVVTDEDDGGVHDNSGIPNRAFALFAISVGGKAWKTAGHIWFEVATGGRLPKDCDFQTFANETVAVCAKKAPAELDKLKAAWAAVGITVK